ncbi:MAG: HAD hydrolase-like protein [Alphaproteobacteria bacterium]
MGTRWYTPGRSERWPGDDLWSDIGGGREAGLATVQVKTGKYRPEDDSHPSIRPHHRLASVTELSALIEGERRLRRHDGERGRRR